MTGNDILSEMWQLLASIQNFKNWLTKPISREFNMTSRQFQTLVYISQANGLSLRELAELMDMNDGNASTLCKKLEVRGFIIRKRRKDDERYISLILTEHGSAVISRFQQRLAHQFEAVGEETIQDLTTGLHALQKIIAQTNRKEDAHYARKK
ncbi:MarR family winged helix-turn-helix transcriptional regulator [Jeotgalibaca sp. A122]|uniref:MarR family winged helix-turn-helix transcriptional regulator n=1 Tax=Jeotgalibaca sp. A122 TaxID=3457322 RepID=UPI003FD4EBE4